MRVPNVVERAADWIVGLVSPKRLAMRQHFRRMGNPEYARMFGAVANARGYKSALPAGNGMSPWLDSGMSADAEISQSLTRMIARSRELNRDDPIASGLARTFESNVIGIGLHPQASTGDEVKNELAEEVWNERKDLLAPAEDMTHAEYQRMIYSKSREDGGILVKKSVAAPGEPIFFEAVEVDRLNPFRVNIVRLTNGGTIRNGVEKDRFGRVVAYHISKDHPGDVGIGGAFSGGDIKRVSKDQIVHVKRSALARPGQSRGVPDNHAVTQDLRDIDLLIVASLKRTQIAACLAGFVTSEAGVNDIFPNTSARKYGFQMQQQLEPGMLFKLFPGEKIETLVPNFPTPEFVPFIIMLARRIGAALGVSWQIVLKDFSTANYSSARTDLLEARQTWTKDVKWFTSKFLVWQWTVVLQDAKLRGDPRLRTHTMEELAKVDWIHQGWRWIDPLKEGQATQVKLDIGLTTLRDEAAAEGKDYRELMAQQIKEEALRKELREAAGLGSVSDENDSADQDDDQDDDSPARQAWLAKVAA